MNIVHFRCSPRRTHAGVQWHAGGFFCYPTCRALCMKLKSSIRKQTTWKPSMVRKTETHEMNVNLQSIAVHVVLLRRSRWSSNQLLLSSRASRIYDAMVPGIADLTRGTRNPSKHIRRSDKTRSMRGCWVQFRFL